MPLSFFFARKRSASTANRARLIRFESLERRMLLAANPVAEGEGPVNQVPDFHLVDVNPNSTTYDSEFSPRDLLGQTGALYFSHSTWGYCRGQFGYLDQMQSELRSEYPDLPIQIVGINEYGHESGNPMMTAGRTSPVLQDVDANDNGSSDVWYDQWDVTFRDVKILNKQNELIGTVNLTPPAGFDLNADINYNALKQIITDVAHEHPFWQNANDPVDVNDDQVITPVDFLQCINELNERRISNSESSLPLPMPPLMPTPYVDVNGDGFVTPNDALRVLNRINAASSEAEGESMSERACLSDDSPGESGCSLFAASAPGRRELATKPTTQHALPKANDEWSERRQVDRQIDRGGNPLGTIRKTTAKRGISFEADSSTLPGDAVDSVFRGDADMLLADSLTGSLIRDWPFSWR